MEIMDTGKKAGLKEVKLFGLGYIDIKVIL